MNRLTLSLLAGLAGCVPALGCPEGSHFDDVLGSLPSDAGPAADASDAGPSAAGDAEPFPASDAPGASGDAGLDGATGADACTAHTFYVDGDGDGFGAAEDSVRACVAPAGHSDAAGDCDDASGDVSPAATERCDMRMVDDDCDGTSNEGCECWEGQTRSCPGASDVGECLAGVQTCGIDGRWPSACEGTVGPAAERCDGLDNDCDAVVDGASADGTCPTWVGGTPRCLAGGVCGGSCSATRADCSPGGGCETVLGTLSACTACGDVCAWRCEGSAGCDDPVAVSVGVAGPHTVCARSERGDFYCWGDNSAGEVPGGLASEVSRPTPGAAVLPGRILDVAIGADHACAIVASGTATEGAVRCWGHNDFGQLGNGTRTASTTPVSVAISNAIELAAGLYSTCALLRTGEVRCWGEGSNGQLGDGSTMSRLAPVAVADLTGARRLDGASLRYCAVAGTGEVVCWGQGHTGRQRYSFDSRTAVEVAVGTAHTCAIAEGTIGAPLVVACWGEGSGGEIGDGASTRRDTPVVVPGAFGPGTAPLALSAGAGHTCVASTDGTVRCWGRNDSGQVGNGRTTAQTTPVVLGMLDEVVAIDAGFAATCAVTARGAVWCWGQNGAGELGDGTTSPRSMPVQVLAP
jgi:alpha-tubulin suppressor-like RCC1 family protein